MRIKKSEEINKNRGKNESVVCDKRKNNLSHHQRFIMSQYILYNNKDTEVHEIIKTIEQDVFNSFHIDI